MKTTNMEQNAIEAYMQLSEQKRIIEEQLDQLKPIVIESMGDEPINNWKFVLSKITKRLPKLKEWVSITDIMNTLPEAVKYSPDMKWLQKNSAGHQYIEFEKSEYLSLRSAWKNE